jgi:hypothetical protein
VTSLKAYRVEFIGLLTEYPGTDNEKVGTQNAIGAAVKSKQMSLGLSQQKAEVVCESPEWAIGGDLTLGDQG